MKQYEDKVELVTAIKNSFEKYINEFYDIPDEMRNVEVDGVDKTPSQNLSYQLGWINLLLSWEQDELNGKVPVMPAEGYKWNDLGGLYQTFYEKYESYSLEEQINSLQESVNRLVDWIDTLSTEELFEVDQKKWADTPAKWPVWKWVHINSVAPFTNFRPQIRKWKKIAM